MNYNQRKYLSCYIALILSLNVPQVFGTEIFRSEDASGRVTYSDKTMEGARQVKLPDRVYRHLHWVKSVYDGDTIVLENGQRVRLLGVNTPEIESRHRASEPGGAAAKEWLQNQLHGQKVYLEYDLEKHDKYKRLLAHVFLSDGKHINLELLKEGLAFVNIIPPNIRHADLFSQAQQHAENKKLGIWGLPHYQARSLSLISSDDKGWKRYIGTPQKIQHKRKFTYLVFDEHVNIRIANDNLKLFPALETYLGKTIEIRGWISRSSGKFSFKIYHPSALILQ